MVYELKHHDGSEDKTVKLFHDFKEALHHSIGFLLHILFASSEFKGPLNLFQSSDGNIPKPCSYLSLFNLYSIFHDLAGFRFHMKFFSLFFHAKCVLFS